MKTKLVGYIGVAALSLLAVTQAPAVPVSLELALLVDVSGSIITSEFDLQQNGYKNAFLDAGIQALISDPAKVPGGIAVTYIQWASGNQQATKVGWTHLYDAASATAFANAVGASTRSFSGNTGPGSAINYAAPLFINNGFEGIHQVIDVSGDGTQNSGADTSDARDAALLAGIDKLNGLVIGGGESLKNWYVSNVQGGSDSFTLQVADFDGFESAIMTKISAEIQNQNPTPDVGVGLGMTSLLFGGLFLLRGRKS